QLAFDRVEASLPVENAWVITAGAYAGDVRMQLPAIPANQVIGEPCGRDTAACIGLGAALIHRGDPDATMMVMPADHVIEPAQEFRRAAAVAQQMVDEHPGALVTFGIPPTYPSVNYGYIHRGPEIATRQGILVHRVRGFREKPVANVAEQYVTSGEYYWN